MNTCLSKLCLLLFLLVFSISSASSQNLVKGGNMEDPTAWNVHQYNVPAEPTFVFNYTDTLPKFGRGGCLNVVCGEAFGQLLLWQRIKLIAGKTYRATAAITCLDYNPGPTGGLAWYQMYIDTAQVVAAKDYNPGAIKFLALQSNWEGFPTTFDDFFESVDMRKGGVPSAPYYTPPGTPGTEVEVTFGLKFGHWWTDYTGTSFELLVDEVGLIPVEAAMNAGGNMEDAVAWNVHQYNVPAEPTFVFNYTDTLPKFGRGGCLNVVCGEAFGQLLLWQRIKLIAGETYRATGAIACLDYNGGPVGGGAWYQMYIDTAQVVPEKDYNPGAIKFFNMDGWQADFPTIFDNFWESENLYAGVPSAPYYTAPGTPGSEVEVTFGIKFGHWWTDYTGTSFELLVDDIYLLPLTKAGVVTAVETEPVKPGAFELAQNYPNPFNPVTTIDYSLAKNSQVKLVVLNLLGQQVATLVDGMVKAGAHRVVWNAAQAPSGIYFYRLQTEDNVRIRKMTLMK